MYVKIYLKNMASKSVFIFTCSFILPLLFIPVFSTDCVWPEEKCVGNDKYQCNDLGFWEYIEACPPGTICKKQTLSSIYVINANARCRELSFSVCHIKYIFII